MLCRIHNCRYPDSHTTPGHVCGRCYRLGHGQVECGNQSKIDALVVHKEEMPDGQTCVFEECGSRYHIKSGHRCDLCNRYGHSNTACPSAEKIKMIFGCPICKAPTEMLLNQRPIFLNTTCSICHEVVKAFPLPCGHSDFCYDCIVRLSRPYSVFPEDQIPDYLVTSARKLFDTKPGQLYTIGPGGQGSSWYIRRAGLDEHLYGFMIDQGMHGQYGVSDYPKAAYFVMGHKYLEMPMGI